MAAKDGHQEGDASASSSGGSRRERKQKFDVRELLKIRGGPGGTPAPKPNGNSVKKDMKARRSGRVKATASVATAKPSPGTSTTNGSLSHESSPVQTPKCKDPLLKEAEPVIIGKRERKRKKFWDEQDSPASPASKVSKKSDEKKSGTPTSGGVKKCNSKSNAVGSGSVAKKESVAKKNHSMLHPQNGKNLHYQHIDLDRDPAAIAKELEEGFNIPGPGQPIHVDSSSLPSGWQKKVVQRGIGITKGKWEVFILSPEGKSFRSKMELQKFFDEKRVQLKVENFDFSLDDSLKRLRQIWKMYVINPRKVTESSNSPNTDTKARKPSGSDRKTDGENANNPSISSAATDIGVESETGQGVRCSIGMCGKLFRNDRLLQMHVKHYHPNVFESFNSSFKKDVAKSGRNSSVESRADLELTAISGVRSSSNAEQSILQGTRSERNRKLSANADRPESKRSTLDESKKTLSRPPCVSKQVTPGSELETSFHSADSLSTPGTCNEATGILRHDLEDVILKGSSQVANNSSNFPSTPPTFRVSKRRQAQLKKKNLSPVLKMSRVDDTTDGKCYMEEYMNILGSPKNDINNENDGSAPSSYPPSEMGASVASEHLTSEEVVNCTCKRIEEDGLMIQCDICLCWQHGSCLGLDEEDKVPEKHVCQICRDPPSGRPGSALLLDQDWLKEGKLNMVCLPDVKINEVQTNVSDREGTFKKLSDLMADLSNMSKMLHSLRVKLDVASQPNCSKVFMWSSPWESCSVLSALLPPKQEVAQASSTIESFDKGVKNSEMLTPTSLQPPQLPISDRVNGDMLSPDMSTNYRDSSRTRFEEQDGNNVEKVSNATNVLANEANSTTVSKVSEESSLSVDVNCKNDEKQKEFNKEGAVSANDTKPSVDAELDHSTVDEELQVDQLDPSMIPSVSEVAQLLPSILEAANLDGQLAGNSTTGEANMLIPQAPLTVPPPVIIPEQKRIDKHESRSNLLDHIGSLHKELDLLLDHVETRLSDLQVGDEVDIPESVFNRSKAVSIMLFQDLQIARNLISTIQS